MNSNKKAKTDDDAFAKVKEYLLACPDVAADHPAIVAALRGVAQEERQRDRDAKLQKKFAKSAQVNSGGILHATKSTDTDMEVIDHEEQVPKRMSPNTTEDTSDDWHEVPAGDELAADSSAATLGEELAKATVQSISRHKILMRTPFQALVAALNAALRSEMLDFRCIGKEEQQPVTGGFARFAPPERELSAAQFLPQNAWSDTTRIALRYRKAGMGAMVLTVTETSGESNEPSISITFGSARSAETAAEPLLFKISDHINLESWYCASNGGKKIPPSLHYKHLSTFLTLFCQRFDVGTIQDGSAATEADSLPYVDQTIVALPRPDPANALPTTVPPQNDRPVEPWMREQFQPPTVDSAFGLRIPNRGDFAGDIMPGGLQIDPQQGGNLMGPGHPMFGVGPNGMTPRFDPFGPPQPDIGNTRGGRGRPAPGRPNPDHMRPPNNLNNIY